MRQTGAPQGPTTTLDPIRSHMMSMMGGSTLGLIWFRQYNTCVRGSNVKRFASVCVKAPSNRSYFERPADVDFSLGPQYLQEFMDAKDDAMQASAFIQTPIRWQMVLAQRANFLHTARAWYSLFAVRGTLLFHIASKKGGVVIYSCASGVIYLLGDLKKVGDVTYVEFPKEFKVDYACVVGTEGWTSKRLVGIPPIVARKRKFSPNIPGGLVCQVRADDKGTLLSTAAYTGFKSLTVPFMKKLVDDFAIPYAPPKPTTERDLATLCVSWVLPELSEVLTLERSRVEFQSVSFYETSSPNPTRRK
jgi:hypothetical protein